MFDRLKKRLAERKKEIIKKRILHHIKHSKMPPPPIFFARYDKYCKEGNSKTFQQWFDEIGFEQWWAERGASPQERYEILCKECFGAGKFQQGDGSNPHKQDKGGNEANSHHHHHNDPHFHQKHKLFDHHRKYPHIHYYYDHNEPLISLSIAEPGEYQFITTLCEHEMAHRLLEMGFIPETIIKVISNTGANGTVMIEIKGSKLALNSRIANDIVIKTKS